MSSKKAVLFSETKMDEWVYKSPVKNSRNGLNLFIDASKTNQSSVKVQFPKCRCPFGIQEKKADATEFSRRNLELSADDEAMQKWVAAFDDLNCKKAAANSEEWFRKKLSQEALGELYRQCLQVSTKDPEKYAPLVRVKVAETGKNPTNIFVVYKEGETEKYKRGSVDDLNRNCYVVPQFEVSGLWFVSKGFGATLVCTDLLVWPAEEEEEFGFVGFGGLTKGEADAGEPAAKRHRAEDDGSAAAPSASLFGGGAPIE